jgi:tripeptide aminopeptidase
MLTGYSNQTLIDRFFRYTSIDTQSNPASDTQPSTARQLDLSRVLLQELRDMGYE